MNITTNLPCVKIVTKLDILLDTESSLITLGYEYRNFKIWGTEFLVAPTTNESIPIPTMASWNLDFTLWLVNIDNGVKLFHLNSSLVPKRFVESTVGPALRTIGFAGITDIEDGDIFILQPAGFEYAGDFSNDFNIDFYTI